MGRREEALAAADEAVEKFRQLAQARPGAFLPALAMSLNNYGNRLSDLGRREEALAATGEAVEILRQLAQAGPDAFLPDLAMSLGAMASAIHEDAEAAPVFLEGARMLLPLFRKLPKAHGGLMEQLLSDYLPRAENAGIAPDMELLIEVAAIFQATQGDPS